MEHTPLWTCLLLTVMSSTAVYGCFESCTVAFNQKISSASQQTEIELIANATCSAVQDYSNCMKNIIGQCDETTKPLILSTIQSTDNNYNSTCKENATIIVSKAYNCTNQSTQCFQNSNITSLTTQINADPAAVCRGLEYYTNCTKQLMTTECSSYMGYANNKLENMRSQLSAVCSTGTSTAFQGFTVDQSAIQCFDRTVTCFRDSIGLILNTNSVSREIIKMCNAVNGFNTCVNNVISDVTCQPYANQLRIESQKTNARYSTLCGQDGGKTADQCFSQFDDCYKPFNSSYYNSLQTNDFVTVCQDIKKISICASKFSKQCMFYLSNNLYGIEQIQRQYAYRCSEENRNYIACKPLIKCSQDLIRSFTDRKISRTASSVCANTIDTLFPCVEKAFDRCSLDNGIDIKKIGNVGANYCQHLTNDATIGTCKQVMMCQMNMNFSISDPFQMTNSIFWCGYISASVDCIQGVITRNDCPYVTYDKRQDLLTKIDNLEKNLKESCTAKQPVVTKAPETNTGAESQGNKDNHAAGLQTYVWPVLMFSLIISMMN